MFPLTLFRSRGPAHWGRGETSHWWLWDKEIDLSGSLRRVLSISGGELCHLATSRQSVLSSFRNMTEVSPVYEALRVVFACVTVKLSPGS